VDFSWAVIRMHICQNLKRTRAYARCGARHVLQKDRRDFGALVLRVEAAWCSYLWSIIGGSKGWAHCSEGHLIVSVSYPFPSPWGNLFPLSTNLRYRACILYLVMSSTRGVADLDCLDIILKCSSAAQFWIALRPLLRCAWELHLGRGLPKLAVIRSFFL